MAFLFENRNKFQRRLFCECGYSVYDDGFQSEFFRHYQPCPECGDDFRPTEKNVRWEDGLLKENPTFWQRMFKIREKGKWIEGGGAMSTKPEVPRCPVCFSDSRKFGNMRPCENEFHTPVPSTDWIAKAAKEAAEELHTHTYGNGGGRLTEAQTAAIIQSAIERNAK
jgi:hypothetical protein